MLSLTRFAPPDAEPAHHLLLPMEQRRKSRLRAALDSGRPVGVVLPRGSVLRDGDKLVGDEGVVVSVRAASEALSVARTADPWLFARACYHLGNRHVPLQIGDGELRYLHDHVLDDLLRALGLIVFSLHAPFEPEAGAYAGGGHHHHHHDDEAHGHQHSHGA